MEKSKNDFSLKICLSPGKYEYKFIVNKDNKENWITDKLKACINNNNLIVVNENICKYSFDLHIAR